MEFRSHNIELTSGVWTLPGAEPMQKRQPVSQAVEILRDNLPAGSTVLDLGCLEGGFAVEFARAGYDVTGLEVRQSNFARCQYVADRVGLSNLRFVKDDAWQAELLGQFDCVFCGGLLYHIDRVAAFADLLSSLTNQLLIVNTHFAVESGPQQHKLDPITEHDGYRGRWYTEFPDLATFANREQYHLSSWDNRRSFWLLRDELPRLLTDVGFASVTDLAPLADPTGFNRGAFVAKRLSETP
jgi:SAM-dependent methyltransferase